MPPLAAAALAVLVAFLPTIQSAAKRPPKDPRALFEAALEQVARSIGAGRFSQARETLIAAIAEHGAADYVLDSLPGIQEDLEQCAFWSQYKRPQAEDAVAGELVSCDARTGEIKLRYRLDASKRKKLAKQRRGTRKLPFESDFEESEEIYVHPLVFRGPYSLEIRCGPIGAHQPRVAACMQQTGFYLFSIGSPAAIYRIEGQTRRELAFTTNTLSYGKPLRVQLDVKDSAVALYVDGTELATCKKEKGSWGQLGFYDFPDVEEIVVSGKAEPAWIEGRIDAEVQKARAEFDEKYDAGADLPEVLRPHVARTAALEDEDLFEVAPGPDTPERAGRIQAIAGLLEKGDWKSGLALTSSWSGTSDAAISAWFGALFQLAGGRLREAQLALATLVQLEPGFWPARSLVASLRADTQPRARTIEEARALVAELPKEPRAREWLATAYLAAGQTDEARAVLEVAHNEGLESPGLDRRRRVLARSIRGPEWSRAFESVSTHYVVRSDISRELCIEAGEALEAIHQKLDVGLRRVRGAGKTKFRVFLFSGRNGYYSYAGDVFGAAPEQTAGMYSSVLKQLLIWNLPKREEMLRTIRHEGFHQYFDQVVDHAPRWLNEGLAEYFELSRIVGGKWRDGIVHPDHLAVLSHGARVPLAELLTMAPGKFYSRASLHYAESWAFVHFLLKSKPAERKRFDQLLDGLIAGQETSAVIERVFPEKDLAELTQRFWSHVDSLDD